LRAWASRKHNENQTRKKVEKKYDPNRCFAVRGGMYKVMFPSELELAAEKMTKEARNETPYRRSPMAPYPVPCILLMGGKGGVWGKNQGWVIKKSTEKKRLFPGLK